MKTVCKLKIDVSYSFIITYSMRITVLTINPRALIPRGVAYYPMTMSVDLAIDNIEGNRLPT